MIQLETHLEKNLGFNQPLRDLGVAARVGADAPKRIASCVASSSRQSRAA